jgi:hypothetical protein
MREMLENDVEDERNYADQLAVAALASPFRVPPQWARRVARSDLRSGNQPKDEALTRR